jgi:hypothetical protein
MQEDRKIPDLSPAMLVNNARIMGEMERRGYKRRADAKYYLSGSKNSSGSEIRLFCLDNIQVSKSPGIRPLKGV